MSLYPSLEDMKVDLMEKAQIKAEAPKIESGYRNTMHYPSAPIYPSTSPSAPSAPSDLPYPVNPNFNTELYPSLSDYMGLELSKSVIAANMPEYLPPAVNLANMIAICPGKDVSPTENKMIAPLSNQTVGLKRAAVTHGIREAMLCKDGSGLIGVRVASINNGVFVSLVSKNSPAALCGLRFGDQILQINGTNVAGMTMKQVHDIFRKCKPNGINLIIRDRPFERTVTLHKDSYGHIGFRFKNGEINMLVKDSSASRNGLLTEHQLLEVDGQNVIGLKDKDITEIIEKCAGPVTVTVIPTFIFKHMIKTMNVSILKNMDHSVPDV